MAVFGREALLGSTAITDAPRTTETWAALHRAHARVMAELAERLGLSPSATTRLVDRLEERGWVRRESPRENRRTIRVLITTERRRAYGRNNLPFTAAVEEAMTARMSDDEMSQLIGLLGRLCRDRPATGPQKDL